MIGLHYTKEESMTDVRTVLYTQDFEPVIVLRIPEWKADYAANHGYLEVKLPLNTYQAEDSSAKFEVISLKYEKSQYNGKEGFILIVDHEELIAALKQQVVSGHSFTFFSSSDAADLMKRFFEAVRT